MSSSNTGTLLNQSNKTSFNGSSVASPNVNANKQGHANLDVIEEELQIEEGNENEFESQRNTLHKIRQATSSWPDKHGDPSDKQKDNEITSSELEAAANAELDPAELNDDQFQHLEKAT